MTPPTDRPARHAVYSALMWPEWNQTSESYGTGQEKAEALLNAHAAEVLAAEQQCGSRSLPTYSGNVVRCVLPAGHARQCQSATEYPYVSWPNPSNGGWNPEPAPAEEPETDEQRADRLETERLHAAGDHEYCGPTCEVEFPSEMLRNGILCRAIPGSAAMLDELLRRAAQPEPEAEAAPLAVGGRYKHRTEDRTVTITRLWVDEYECAAVAFEWRDDKPGQCGSALTAEMFHRIYQPAP